ncbi:uncharacterized protein BDZ99DRAFT_291607 [Mytilinidion resinicola]|uniref:F-box domain-containing protein n=1 Tax=Mytilinidion resinicola TaxID=574789 RepID=A0A6A6YQY4_9PEZI|nr:uncharacterized protein BDZ99DRAFT_291607 [Mytilinidion resinicola]KAF2810943.1 hypothetical protein BDZ99DRAFT_291607 [Mytilinidion resinicola]
MGQHKAQLKTHCETRYTGDSIVQSPEPTFHSTGHQQRCPQPERQVQSFNFIGLPKELRLMVYDHIPRVAHRAFRTSHSTVTWNDWTYESAILRTCHEVYDEASASINRLVSKPRLTQLLIPNPRALHTLVSLLSAVRTLKEKEVTSRSELGRALNSPTAYTGSPEATPLRRIESRLYDGSVVEIILRFDAIDRVVDPEMYINNYHTSILALDLWVARHPAAQVEVTITSVEGGDDDFMNQARAHFNPASIALKWVTATQEEMKASWR